MKIQKAKIVYGSFLSSTCLDFKKISCAESGSSRHNFKVPICYTLDSLFWVLNFGILPIFCVLNQNISKTRDNLKIMFTVLNSTNLNVSKLVEKTQKEFQNL